MKILNAINKLLCKTSYYIELSDTTNQQKSSKLFENVNNVLSIIGQAFLREEFSIKSSTFVKRTVISLILLTISMFYSFYIYFNNLDKLLSLTVLLSIFCQEIMKIVLFVQNRDKILQLKQLCGDIISALNNDEMQMRFEKWILICFHFNLLALVLSVFAILCLTSFPLIFTLYNNRFILNYDFIIPFSNPDILSGYVVNYLFQSVLIILGVIGFAGSSTVVVNFIIHSAALFHCSEIYVKELKDVLKNHNQTKNTDRLLKNIIEIHNSNYNLIKTFESCFKFYHLLDLSFSVITIVFCIFGLTLVITLLGN